MRTLAKLAAAVRRRFLNEDDAVSATEYAILLALIVMGAMAAIRGIGERMYVIYENINATMPT